MLLKGVNKRMIVIKNPGSEIFEEAYFIVRSGNAKGIIKQSKENEMVIEANRIISDYNSQQRGITGKNGTASSIGAKTEKKESVNNTEKINKPKKNKTNLPNLSNLSGLSDGEIFEDEKIFENMQCGANKYDDFYCSPFDFISSKKTRGKFLFMPPKSFFAGVGFMSAIIILIRIIEYIILG